MSFCSNQNKTPCVLISGLLSNATLWHHQIRYLPETVVFSPDQNTADKMIQSILEASPPRFALAGHSMGGWICLEIMRQAPERVVKLCLLNTTAKSDSHAKQKNRQENISKAKDGGFKEIATKIANSFVFNSRVLDQVEKMFLEVGLEAFINQEEAMLNRKETQSILKSINCQTLIIHAANDRNFSFQDHNELASSIPRAKLAIIEDCGHMTPLERPQALTTLLRLWLDYDF